MKVGRAAGPAFVLLALVACGGSSPSATAELPSGTRGPRPSTPAAPESGSAAPVETASDSPAPVAVGWVEAGSFGAAGSIEVAHEVAALPSGEFIAIGVWYGVSDLPDTGAVPQEARVWRSADGRAWEAVDTGGAFEDALLQTLTLREDDSLLITGYEQTGGMPLAWTSTDGIAWGAEELSFLGGGGSLADLVGGAGGYVAALNRAGPGGSAELWYSPDGVEWQRAWTRPSSDADLASLSQVAAGPEGFVALGVRGTAGAIVPMVVASGDGRTWVGAMSPPEIQHNETLSTVAPLGGDWVIAGAASGSIPVWTSPDGVHWSRSAQLTDRRGREDFGYTRGLVSNGGRVLLSTALLCCGGLPRPGGSWSSTDGVSWSTLAIPSEAILSGAAVHGKRTVLVGHVGRFEARATMWASE